MTDQPRCPGCGADVMFNHTNWRTFKCLTREFDEFGGGVYRLEESAECKDRQLSALAPLVRAAIVQEKAAQDAARTYGGLGFVPRGATRIWCMDTEEAVRALPPEVRRQFEEDR